jgi:hypothetical protein
VLTQSYPGWTLTEIKTMPARERGYWLELIRWRNEKQHA